MSAALVLQLKEMAKSQRELQQTVGSLAAKVVSLSKIPDPGSAARGEDTYKERLAKGVCTAGGVKGHMRADCPDRVKKEGDQE